MNSKKRGSIAILSAIVALGGVASITPASAHTRAVPKAPTCYTPPCNGIGGTRVTGGTKGSGTGGTRVTGGTKGSGTGGTRVSGGANGKGTGKNGANGKSGAGANANGAGANANGAGANGSSPVPAKGNPVTGYGGTAQDLGASPRSAAAGTQPVVVGLASAPSSQRVAALPATGGGVPSQPASPWLAFLACGLAVLGLGMRKVAGRF
jgi:hypothetical protein